MKESRVAEYYQSQVHAQVTLTHLIPPYLIDHDLFEYTTNTFPVHKFRRHRRHSTPIALRTKTTTANLQAPENSHKTHTGPAAEDSK